MEAQRPLEQPSSVTTELSGYGHSTYAASLADLGWRRYLPACGGWVLERQLPGEPLNDAIGCYPLFSCRDWSALASDLATMTPELVTLTLVTDPFGDFDLDRLRQSFDVVRPFKHHFIVDLQQRGRPTISRHHLRNVRSALAAVNVWQCAQPSRLLGDWLRLYACLTVRHAVTGAAAFSAVAFERQLRVPGIRVFVASEDDDIVGMTLWYVAGELGYYHLGAYSDRGYQLRASFALFSTAIEHFRKSGLRLLTLGGSPGPSDDVESGLARFKRGWSTSTLPVYLCGRIFDEAAYRRLSRDADPPDDYFPAYRARRFPTGPVPPATTKP